MAQLSKEELVLALLNGDVSDNAVLHAMIFDLNGPIHNIIGYLEILAERTPQVDTNSLERIQTNAERIKLYFDAFSEYLHIRKGDLPDPRNQPPATSD